VGQAGMLKNVLDMADIIFATVNSLPEAKPTLRLRQDRLQAKPPSADNGNGPLNGDARASHMTGQAKP